MIQTLSHSSCYSPLRAEDCVGNSAERGDIKMKRLFQVNKPNKKVFAPDGKTPLFFEDKKSAKNERDALNREHPEGGFTTGRGPDHWRNQ